ncbi:MAG: DUF5674 family protein [Actinomycetota bacterium]|nr:DUF5674 family protein [Actinomycetota bacterium]
MDIIIIKKPIVLSELVEIAREQFGDLVKAVVDIDMEIMALGGELHADEEAVLVQHGSKQNNLWGINLYPEEPREEWVEFDSFINIRPSQSNRSRDVENPKTRERIIAIVNKLVIYE